jgi:hypothetical protein
LLAFPLLAVGAALLAGCSALDFFGLEDNAPLHVIERPGDYPSAQFGRVLAPTSAIIDGSQSDFVAVSAGLGTPTVIYRLAADGKLVDVEDPWKNHPGNTSQAQFDGSGSALAGLPLWDDAQGQLVSGCVAIGEPHVADEMGRVALRCEEQGVFVDVMSSDSGLVDEELRRWFGRELAAVPPTTGANWLLAVATRLAGVVLSSYSEHSQILVPSHSGGDFPGEVSEIAAGRLDDGRFFVALTTVDGAQVARLHLFLQDTPASPELVQVACVNRSGEAGFGGEMVSGDLDRDGNYELLVSADNSAGRVEAVYVYDVLELAAAGPECNGDAPEPLAEIAPGDGPLDVACGEGCEFGTALAVGDIATDDDGPEVIVGAPGARVKGKNGAGAVFVYRGREVIAGGGIAVAGQVADSTPQGGHRFGGGVAVAPMAGRNELLIGVIGKGQVVIAFCTGVGEDLAAGADVTSNASGTVISTRCRPK